MNSGLSLLSVIILSVLILVIAFVLIPGLFNSIKRHWYLKRNSGFHNGVNVRNGMYYNADKDEIEADQIPIH
jgi:hypothetical protein